MPETPMIVFALGSPNPRERCATNEAFRFAIDIPEGAPVSTQERAYTAPIWYTPEN